MSLARRMAAEGFSRPEGSVAHTPNCDDRPRQAPSYPGAPGGGFPLMGFRQVRVPAGGHITVHYSIWQEEWATHLYELRGQTDYGPVVEEVFPGERVARFRCGHTSYVAHCLVPRQVQGGGERGIAARDAEERLQGAS